MALKNKDISTILNETIDLNELGIEESFAEDLTNFTDIGTQISANSYVDLRDTAKKIIVGVRNWVLERTLERKRYKFLRDAYEYGGALQRIVEADFYETSTSHMLNLNSAHGSYHDGKYYGTNPTSRVYQDVDTFKIVHSMADDFEKTFVTDLTEFKEWINRVAVKERNSIIKRYNELEKRLINRAIVESIKDGRVIHLLTRFNTLVGNNPVTSAPWTLTQINADRDIKAYYGSFCKSVARQIMDYVKDPNKKYNNGEVVTFCPTEKTACVMLSKFVTDIDYLGTPVEFNPKEFTEFETVNAWQNSGIDLLPDYAICGNITVVDESGDEGKTEYNNICGFIYDVDGIGVTNVHDKITVEPVGAEGFVNYHHHVANKYYVDERFTGVVLVQD